MKTLNTLIGCALIGLWAGSASAATSVSWNLSIGNAPPPPVVVVQHAPETVWIPESRVYVVADRDFDDDTFQCGAFWYSYHDGWWYRSRSWRGPFAVIRETEVPHSVMVVPARHWKRHPHGGPPGQMKKARYVEHRDNGVEPARYKHGKSKGKGKH